jgi:hypothetical protein
MSPHSMILLVAKKLAIIIKKEVPRQGTWSRELLTKFPKKITMFQKCFKKKSPRILKGLSKFLSFFF